MLFVIAIVGIAVIGVLLWSTVTVARMQDIPAWRRFLPLTLFLSSLAASLLRAFDLPGIANTIAFPLNLGGNRPVAAGDPRSAILEGRPDTCRQDAPVSYQYEIKSG